MRPGLVTEVVPPNPLLPTARQVAASIVNKRRDIQRQRDEQAAQRG